MLAIVHGPYEVGVDVMVDDVGDEGGDGHPHGHFGTAVPGDARVYEGAVDVVKGEERVECEVDGVEATLSRQEVGEGEENDAGDQLRDDVGDARRDESLLVSSAVPAVRGRLARLGDEGDDGEEETQHDKAVVDPEANLVGESAERDDRGVVHVEQRVGNAVPEAALRAALGETHLRGTNIHSHGLYVL